MIKNPSNLATGRIKSSTQRYLDISEVKDDVLIMRDGSLRIILLVSSINFALKSEEEQNGIIASYVDFLNNISFPLQVLVQSRELSIDKYLATLKQKEKEQTNERLKLQTSAYIEYIQEMVAIGKIMSKHFHIVIPYYPTGETKRGFFKSLASSLKPATLIKMKEDVFKERKKKIMIRVNNVVGGLMGMGLNSTQLDTQSLIELFYNSYNPKVSKNQKLVDTDSLRISR